MGALAFVGDWGSSKTLGMVKWLQDGVERGYDAASNFGFEGGIDFATSSELLTLVADRLRTPLRDRVPLRVAFDEAGQMFPCRGHSKFPPAMELVCHEARKLKIEIAYAVPNLSRVDLNLRLATSAVIRCNGFFYKPIEHPDYGSITRPRLVCWTRYGYHDDKLQDREGRRWVRWSKLAPYKDLYDSFFLIESVAFQLEAASAVVDRADAEGSDTGWGDASSPQVAVSVKIRDRLATRQRGERS